MFGRADIAAAVDMLIERLDTRDGDPDLEDSEAGDSMIDDRGRVLADYGPGADDDAEPDDDAKGDPSWSEWHTRGRHKLGRDGEEQCRTRGTPNMALEDDEDDDPREENGDEQDGNIAEDEPVAWFASLKNGPGCTVSDVDRDDSSFEPWFVPATLNPPMSDNDR